MPTHKYNKLEIEKPYLPVEPKTHPGPYKPNHNRKSDSNALFSHIFRLGPGLSFTNHPHPSCLRQNQTQPMPECLQFYMKNKDTLFFSHPFETSLINTLLVLHTNLCKKTTWYDFQGNCEFQKSLCNKKLMKFISINQYIGRHHYYQNQKNCEK